MMGGDIKISYFQPLTEESVPGLKNGLSLPNIKSSSQMGFTAMLRKDKTPLVVQVKVVDQAYPLLGSIKTKENVYTMPKDSEIWISTDIAERLAVSKGSEVTLGNAVFTIAGIFEALPDIENTSALFGGKILISEAGFAHSGIDRKTSRVDYTLTITTPSTAVAENIKTSLTTGNISKSVRIRLANEEGGRVNRTFQTAENFFLGFLGLLIALFGGTLLLGVEHFFTKERRHIALLKAMGMPTKNLLGGYLGIMGIWCIVLGFFGSALGLITLLFLPNIVPEEFNIFSTTFSFFHIFPGIGIAILFFLMASGELLSPILTLSPRTLLRDVPEDSPLSRISSSSDQNPKKTFFTNILENGKILLQKNAPGLKKALFLSVLWILSGVLFFPKITTALYFSAMGIGILTVALSFFHLLQKWFNALHQRIKHPFLLRILLSVFHRPKRGTRLVFLSLFLAFFAICTAGSFGKSVQNELSLSQNENAPTFVLFDVSEENVPTINTIIPKVEWYPIVRTYLEEWKGTKIRENEESYPQAQRAFSATAREKMSTEETMTAGTWWTAGVPESVVSVEKTFADEMGIVLGDSLTFDMQGKKIVATVKSIRSIGEDRFSPWFIFVFPPHLLVGAPASYLGFSWEEESHLSALQSQIVQKFPSVTTIKTKELSGQITVIVDKVLLLVRILTFLLLGAGVLSFIAMILVNKETQKRTEWRFFRLGAPKKWVSWFFMGETVFLTVFPFIMAFAMSVGVLVMSGLFVPFLPLLVVNWLPVWGFLGVGIVWGVGKKLL